jgi:glutaredoxin 3
MVEFGKLALLPPATASAFWIACDATRLVPGASDGARAMIADVKVYTTNSCAYCVRAKALLAKRDVPFEEIDVTSDPDKRAWLVKESGMRTVPQVFVDGKSIGGSDELHALDRSGELERLLHR